MSAFPLTVCSSRFLLCIIPIAVSGLPPSAYADTVSVGVVHAEPWRHRTAEAIAAVERREGTKQAIDHALEWIVKQRISDGGWSFDLIHGGLTAAPTNCPVCEGPCSYPNVSHDRCAATALAILPFLGRGFSHRQGPYQKELKGGIEFLIAMGSQQNGKCYDANGSMVSQGLAAFALCDAYGLTNDERLRAPAQAAIDFIMDSQDPAGGWAADAGQPAEMSCTGWQVLALRSGNMAGLEVRPPITKKCPLFLDSLGTAEGAFYGASNRGKEPSATATALLLRIFLGWKDDQPRLRQGAEFVAEAGPTEELVHDLFGSELMHQMGRDFWAGWRPKMKDMLIKAQALEGGAVGSWYEGVARNKAATTCGRLYCTALATLILETPYREKRVFEAAPAVGPRCDELSEDTNKIESLTPEQAQKVVEQFEREEGVEIKQEDGSTVVLTRFGGLSLDGLKSLDSQTAKVISGYSNGPLALNGLTSLAADAARALGNAKSTSLALNGLTNLDADTAKALAEFKGISLSLNGLTTLDAETAKALAEFKGERLCLSGLTSLSPEAATALAEFKGWALVLRGVTTLDVETGKALAKFKGNTIYLDGVTSLGADTAKALAAFKGSKLYGLSLSGLTELDAATARAFVPFEGGVLDLSGLKQIDADTASALAERKGGTLYLDGLKEIDADITKTLMKFEGEIFPLREQYQFLR